MQMQHRVALDGVWLDEVDSRIIIQKIETSDGKESINITSLAGSSGSRVSSPPHRDSLDILVKFAIRVKKKEMAEREMILEKVNAWAFAGGWLTVNYKSNRRIRVFRAQAAGAGDPWEWTKQYQIVFRACGVPYWQEDQPETLSRANVSDETFQFGQSGSENGVLDVSFQNTSGSTINTFSLSTNDSSMEFSALGLANNEMLVIDHDDNGKRCNLRIRIKSTAGVYRSALGKRTNGSSDDRTIIHQIQIHAGGSGKLTLRGYGRFA